MLLNYVHNIIICSNTSLNVICVENNAHPSSCSRFVRSKNNIHKIIGTMSFILHDNIKTKMTFSDS